MQPINIAIVDDHKLLRQGLQEVLQKNTSFRVVLQADHGKDLIQQLKTLEKLPDLILLDINMPVMNGYETAAWLKEHHPTLKVMALSMYDNESAIIRMLKNGVRGYVLKDAENEELQEAIHRIMTTGYYYSELVLGALSKNLMSTNGVLQHPGNLINEQEMKFLKLACTELTYKEIADRMNLSARTIDGYRESLFEKLTVKSRVGLVMYAIKNGLV